MRRRKEFPPYFKDENGQMVYIAGAIIAEDGTVSKPASGNGKNYRHLNNYNNENGDGENGGNGSNGNGNGSNDSGKLPYFQNPDGTISFSRKDWNEAREGFKDSITRV